MLVSFTGAQSTGKTTLQERCIKEFPSFEFVPEITRVIARKGIPINIAGGDMSQLLVVNTHIENSLKTHAFLNRCILDGLIYTKYLHDKKHVSDWVWEYAKHVYYMLMGSAVYDKIFYTSPVGVPLVDDQTRVIGEEGIRFRNSIIGLFEYYINSDRGLLDVGNKLVILSGSVEERMATIRKHLA